MIYIDNNYISIKNYQGILLLQNNLVEIKLPQQLLQITGQELEIRYFCHEEIVIIGKIRSLKFS
ncbi:YabP/YqfC family sporulation protein [uncultured Thomasclavelia sp.]|uniref:YabP/YqfC family sporulation protein n=1 Tax=uncultured Thomasclavelia sp. TaxID=3025759 RepID=UPI0025D5CE24|nr:YabP/YqfC family sporulation protein [uncultured Thomasclavelia sp.]